MDLGVYAFPRMSRGMFGENYPWIEADIGDWFTVIAADLDRARNSLRACRWGFRRSVDWAPEFEIDRASDALIVRRVA
jgi:hypothetical protein